MNPEQTAPLWEQSDLGPCCLQYRLPKNIRRRWKQATKVVTGGKGLRHVASIPSLSMHFQKGTLPVCYKYHYLMSGFIYCRELLHKKLCCTLLSAMF